MKKWLFGIIAATGLLISVESNAQTKTVSRARKNTAIGAGAGAVTGAAVSHKKGKGALIGGVVGAGAGYAWGKHKDRKKGRKVVHHT